MCASPRQQPEHEATDAAKRVLEEEEEARLASASLVAGDPTGWFDRLYAAGARGQVPVPWRRRQPHPLLANWASAQELSGPAQRAVVVGCGLGADAEYIASLGFDISGTAIRLARQRFPGSTVRYVVADLLNYPQAWLRAYDLVIEIITVQALPDPPRRQAIANVSRLVGSGGTLLAIAAVHDDDMPSTTLPPWPLRRAEIEAFGADGLSPTRIEITVIPGEPDDYRWLAEFRRPAPGQPITSAAGWRRTSGSSTRRRAGPGRSPDSRADLTHPASAAGSSAAPASSGMKISPAARSWPVQRRRAGHPSGAATGRQPHAACAGP